ncbi:hypothetical protein D1872_234360 [compost metagenome]
MSLYNPLDNRLDHIYNDLLNVLGFKQLTALFINNFTLLIHHIVILKHDFTNVKVIAFYPFLSRFNRTCYHFALDRLIFFKTKTFHHVQHVVRTKTFHQFIAKR